jgi:hypothetical protein
MTTMDVELNGRGGGDMRIVEIALLGNGKKWTSLVHPGTNEEDIKLYPMPWVIKNLHGTSSLFVWCCM